eukprot:5561133-Amphidinium_carterae.1
MSKGKKKRRESQKKEIHFGQIFVGSHDMAVTWCKCLADHLPRICEDWCSEQLPSRLVPGASCKVAQYMWSSDEEIPSTWMVVLMDNPQSATLREQLCSGAKQFVLLLQDDVTTPDWAHASSKVLISQIKMSAGHVALLLTNSSHILTRLSLAAPLSDESLMQTMVKAYSEVQPMPSELFGVHVQCDLGALESLSWTELCVLIEHRLNNICLPRVTARQCVTGGDMDTPVRGVVLGATTRRGARITTASEQPCWLELLPCLHELARRRTSEHQHPYLSIAVTTGAVAKHQDFNGSMTTTLSLGDFTGGALNLATGEQLQTWRQWHMFDGRIAHHVSAYCGTRWSISLFVPGQARALRPDHLVALGKLGFPTKWWLEHSAWEQTLFQQGDLCGAVGDLTEEGSNIAPVPLDDPRATTEADEVEIPSRSQQSSIHRTHCNLGHPTKEAFLRALRVSGVRRSIRRWVFEHYRCPSCEAWRPRLQHRTSTLPKTMTFNETLAMDCLILNPPGLASETWLHCIDMGTRYQTACKVGDGHTPTSASVLHGLQTCWLIPFGFPRHVLLDQGSEFKQTLRQYLEQHHTQVLVTNAQSPWENGVCERAGGRLKEILQLTWEDVEPYDTNDVFESVVTAVYAHNRFTDRSGFTPFQRVIGVLPRAAVDLLADHDPPAEIASVSGQGTDFHRAQEVRTAALKAFVSHSVRLRVRRAEATHTKPQDNFAVGEVVYILRKGAYNKYYRLGPGKICAVQGNSVWVAAHGEIYKVAAMALRRADPEEVKAVQEMHESLGDMTMDVRRHRQIRDLTQGEGTPEVSASAAEIPATPRLPGTPARRRRASVISTTASAASGVETVPSLAETEDDRAQALRRRVEPGIAEHIQRIEPHRAVEVREQNDLEMGENGDDDPASTMPSTRPQPAPEHELDVPMFQCWQDVLWSSCPTEPCTISDETTIAAFSCEQHVYMVTRKGSDEVRLSDVAQQDMPGFEKAKASECHKMIHDHEGLIPLFDKESAEIRREKRDRIIPSRFHWRWKPETVGDTVTTVPKCRWILIGFKDPDVLTLDGESPTPQLFSLNALLQAVASQRWELFQGDLQTAFLQGGPTTREIYVEQPPEGVPNMRHGQLLRMNKEIYGSVAAPQRWRQSFVAKILALGWRQTQADPCIYVLPAQGQTKGSSGGVNAEDLLSESQYLTPPTVTRHLHDQREPAEGVMAVLVDDILEAGTSRHRQLVSQLMTAFKFGKHESLKTETGSIFNGRRLRQTADFSIRLSMHDFIDNKLQTIKLSRERKRQSEESVTEDERALLRTVLMKVMWAARQSHPEVLGTCVTLASRITQATVADLVELSKTVEHLKAYSRLEIIVHSIPVEEWCLALLVDASPCGGKLENAVGGFIIGVTDGRIHDGVDAPFSVLAWRAGKIERRCSSSLAAESFALVNALAFTEFMHTALCEVTNSAYSRLVSKRRLYQWSHGESLDYRGCLIAKDSLSAELRKNLVVTDAKSLYDQLGKESGMRGREPRLALAAAESREALALLGIKPRWAPHNVCCVDSLTKQWSKSHAEPLMRLLQRGVFRLSPETDVLQSRQIEKSEWGSNQRSKRR